MTHMVGQAPSAVWSTGIWDPPCDSVETADVPKEKLKKKSIVAYDERDVSQGYRRALWRRRRLVCGSRLLHHPGIYSRWDLRCGQQRQLGGNDSDVHNNNVPPHGLPRGGFNGGRNLSSCIAYALYRLACWNTGFLPSRRRPMRVLGRQLDTASPFARTKRGHCEARHGRSVWVECTWTRIAFPGCESA